ARTDHPRASPAPPPPPCPSPPGAGWPQRAPPRFPPIEIEPSGEDEVEIEEADLAMAVFVTALGAEPPIPAALRPPVAAIPDEGPPNTEREQVGPAPRSGEPEPVDVQLAGPDTGFAANGPATEFAAAADGPATGSATAPAANGPAAEL